LFINFRHYFQGGIFDDPLRIRLGLGAFHPGFVVIQSAVFSQSISTQILVGDSVDQTDRVAAFGFRDNFPDSLLRRRTEVNVPATGRHLAHETVIDILDDVVQAVYDTWISRSDNELLCNLSFIDGQGWCWFRRVATDNHQVITKVLDEVSGLLFHGSHLQGIENDFVNAILTYVEIDG